MRTRLWLAIQGISFIGMAVTCGVLEWQTSSLWLMATTAELECWKRYFIVDRSTGGVRLKKPCKRLILTQYAMTPILLFAKLSGRAICP